MELKEEIIKAWRQCFPAVERNWLETFFATALDEDDILLSRDAKGNLVSSLLLQPYRLTFYGQTIPMGYLSFACTMPRYRGMGGMKHLLSQALEVSYTRGDMAVMLVPAADWLRDYYEKAGGWATVFYTREDNYTSVHRFQMGDYREVTDADADTLYDAFSRFEQKQGNCVVLHSRDDFSMILNDLRMDGGAMVAVADSNREICATAVGVPDDFYKVVDVKMAAGRDQAAVAAALECLRHRFPDKRITVNVPASDNDTGGGRRSLTPGGMARIVNVERALDIVARSAPRGWKKTVKVRDRVLPMNNHVYVMRGGWGAVVDDDAAVPELNGFDVDVSVLARMLFGSKPIAEIIDFPGVRPVMNLMLE